MQNIPPFWLAALAIFIVLFIMAEFPRAGGGLLIVLVLVMLLGAKQRGVI